MLQGDMNQLVQEMRAVADSIPFFPDAMLENMRDLEPAVILEKIKPFRREVEIDGYKILMMLTRTVIFEKQFYQFSMSNDSGNPGEIPPGVAQKLKAAFVPNGMSLPSVMGNCLQFIERIK